MQRRKGKFIVLEGTDGSGKSTQLKRLIARLKKTGRGFRTIHFPQHGKPSGYFVDKYLNHGYGEWKGTGPYKVSLFYALDRFDASSRIKQWLKKGDIVIADRYLSSNMGHQGSRIPDERGRISFYKWLYNIEFGILGIPRPDLVIVLHVPTQIAYGLIGQKRDVRKYIQSKKRDLHERNLSHLKQTEQTYVELTKLFPRDFWLVECVKNGKLLNMDEIHEKVWKIAKKIV